MRTNSCHQLNQPTMLASEAIFLLQSQPSGSSASVHASVHASVPHQNRTELKASKLATVSKLETVCILPGRCYDYGDALTQARSHSFAFTLDQTRQVAIDIANNRSPNLLEEILGIRRIQAVLRSESGAQALFSIGPGDRCRETLTLDRGRYLLELKTQTRQQISYALKLTAMKWLLLEYFVE